MKDISANSVDLIICDLPYGCLASKDVVVKRNTDGYKNGGTAMTGCAWDIKIDLQAFWTEAKRILRNSNSPVIHFCTTKFGYELINSNPDWFRYDLVWDKQRGVSFLSANRMPMRSHEMIYVFSKSGAYYNRVDIEGEPYTSKGHSGSKTYSKPPQRGETKIVNTRCIVSVIQQRGIMKKGSHPTEKPISLYEWLIERYCPPGGTVLDPTFGSGNSCFTAYAMGRHAIGFEKDEKFYKKATENITPEQ
jgi:site-specific DNA-methyltransferase (adenine-specific)